MLGNGHVQFGERAGETGQPKRWNRAPTRLYFWRDDGTDQTIHDLLHCQAREKAGRTEDPTAVSAARWAAATPVGLESLPSVTGCRC